MKVGNEKICKTKFYKNKKMVVWSIILIFFFVVIMIYMNIIVNPIIISSSENKVKSLTVKAVNSAIAEVVSESVLYNDLVTTVFDEHGEILMLQANSILINKLSKELAKNAQGKLEIIGNQGVNIPIGTFSGLPILVGRGPAVKIKMIPIGSINCSFESKFEQAGINQTRHRIYVNMNSSVSMILATETKQIRTTTQVLICESIIIGKVPQTYLRSNELQDMMDLVPGS